MMLIYVGSPGGQQNELKSPVSFSYGDERKANPHKGGKLLYSALLASAPFDSDSYLS